jgi:DNA-binding transcriptional LysR family regulator
MQPNVTLKHLRCFVAVAREGGFTPAAKRVFLTQSSLTATIQQIEQAIGLRLFDRTTRKVTMTRDGAAFLPVAERLLNDFDTALADVRAVADRQRGRVSIAAAPSAVTLILAPVIADYRAQYPNISIVVADAGAETVQRRVLTGESDFGIGSRWSDDAALDFRPLVCDRFGVICRADHTLATTKGALTWKKLPLEDYISLASDTGVRAMLQAAPDVPGAVRAPVCEVSSTHSLHAMIAAGLGISVLPALASKMSPLDELVFRELKEPRIEREICLVTPRGRTLSPAAQGMVEMIERYLRGQALPPGVRLTI